MSQSENIPKCRKKLCVRFFVSFFHVNNIRGVIDGLERLLVKSPQNVTVQLTQTPQDISEHAASG